MSSFQILLLLLVAASSASPKTKREQHNAIDQAMRSVFPSLEAHSCPGCADLKADVSERELASLRVEFIKQQILKKLKLKEVPQVGPVGKLPIPIMMHPNHSTKTPEDGEMEEDDFFGKTNQVILFPEEGKSHCALDPDNPSVCFTLQLPKDIEVDDIAHADLWVYKLSDFFDGDPDINQTLIYSDEVDGRGSKVFERHVTKIKDGWVKLDIATTVRSWLDYNERRHKITITCKTCGFQIPWQPVSLRAELQPFLLVNTDTNKKKRRPKRNVNCMPGISECCREKLYISFADIGWSGWVIQPRGYEAYFCRGSCSNAVSLSLTSSGYSSVVKRLSQHGGKRLELVPCCTATHLSPLQLIYMDNNQTITQKTLPNMVVDSCGCM